jgi:hypothetical protein
VERSFLEGAARQPKLLANLAAIVPTKPHIRGREKGRAAELPRIDVAESTFSKKRATRAWFGGSRRHVKTSRSADGALTTRVYGPVRTGRQCRAMRDIAFGDRCSYVT